MKHHILVKWNDQVTDKAAISRQVRALYASACQIEGVENVEVIDNCIDRPNRYDLLIRLTMDAATLPTWDASQLHHDWKEQYSSLILSKAIFDCE